MAEFRTSTLGWVYVWLGAAWTVLLAGGLLYLHRHRRLPFLQIRRLPIVFVAVTLLHLYAVVCLVSYTIHPIIPCDAQFWIMSIYLPFGIALLQAANSQFLYIASQQRRFASYTDLDELQFSEKSAPIDLSLPWWKQMVERVHRMDRTTRIIIYIGVGMAVELALTLFVYFGSEIFHPSYGIFNIEVPGTEQQREAMCLTGWEWWLSIAWQFFWAWIYAPYLLWKSRNIRDTHGWRIQTIGCCIAGLPASPLWLAASYIPQMEAVNAVIFPPMWFSISIFFIEAFVIGFPCWQVIKTHSLQQETLDAIASWEQKNRGSDSCTDAVSASTALGGSTIRGSTIGGSTIGGSVSGKSVKTKTSAKTGDSRRSDMFTMRALENALRNNPRPLLEFAALKDFSAENIGFLSHVADWRRAWVSGPSSSASTDPVSLRYDQFIQGVRIYSHFVSCEYSRFPVNISSRLNKELTSVFDAAANMLNRRNSIQSSGSATPFDDNFSTGSTDDLRDAFDLEATLGKENLKSVATMADLSNEGRTVPVPPSFDPLIFDPAEAEIKYLVLTNTWPKFVHHGLNNVSQSEEKGERDILDGVRKYLCGMERLR